MTGMNLGGLDVVLKNMATWGAAVEKEAKGALFDSLDELLLNAQHDCPVRTGDLRDSLTRYVDPDGMHGQIYTDLNYGPFVETGTRKMAAQPFLYPNWVREVPLFKERIKAAVMV